MTRIPPSWGLNSVRVGAGTLVSALPTLGVPLGQPGVASEAAPLPICTSATAGQLKYGAGREFR